MGPPVRKLRDIWVRFGTPVSTMYRSATLGATKALGRDLHGRAATTEVTCFNGVPGRAQLSFNGIVGTEYLIRIGSFNGLTGAGTLSISGITPPGSLNPRDEGTLWSDRAPGPGPGPLALVLREGATAAFDPTAYYGSLGQRLGAGLALGGC
jgi:hypothetical protein